MKRRGGDRLYLACDIIWVSCRVVGKGNLAQMLNIEAFQDLCRRAAIEKDPAELQNIKEALLFLLRTEEIELYGVEKRPRIKPN